DNKQRDLMADMLVELKSDETGDDIEGSADLPLEASEQN
ncbi:MAG: hypothetical protein ACI934_002249, partial [Pseudohongiellaceae bacterium]